MRKTKQIDTSFPVFFSYIPSWTLNCAVLILMHVYKASSSKLSVPSIGGQYYINYPNYVSFSKCHFKCLEVKRKNSREINVSYPPAQEATSYYTISS